LWWEGYCPECAATLDPALVRQQANRAKNPAASPDHAPHRKPADTAREILSWVIYGLALCLAVWVVVLTAAFFDIVHSKDAWHFAFFVSVLAPVTSLVSVVVVMIPTRILLKRNRGWREIQSFWSSVVSSVLGVVEPIAMILLLAGKHMHMEL
jgi:uncharacterized membrane protein